MQKIKKNLNKWLLAVGILLCLVTGFLFYNLISIPFGFLFNMSFYLLIGSVLFVLMLATVLCFKASKRWISIVGILPLLIFIIIAFITVIISIDYRILYFHGHPPTPTKAEWIEDLHYLSERMEKKYPALYSKVSEETFRRTVKESESRIPEMTDEQIVMEFFRLVALPNDAHSTPLVFFPCFDLHAYPIRIYGFEDGWYIVDAGRSYRQLIGAKLLKIGSANMEDIFHQFPPYLAAESSSAKLDRCTYLALTPEWLKTQGFIREIQQAPFTLEKANGEQVTVVIPSVKMLNCMYWGYIRRIDNNQPPVFNNYRKYPYLFKLLEESKTLYIQCNEVTRQIGEFSELLSEYISTHNFERCVVDIRNNMGGDDSSLWKLVDVIRDSKKINRQGALFVLIGRHTFSSGVLFANKLRLQTKAIFAGEPTAQGAIFNANPDFVQLPNSRLIFAISTTSTSRSQASWPFATGTKITPDIPVQYSYRDFMEGRDPVLEAALKYQPPVSEPVSLQDKILDTYTGRYLLSSVQVMDVTREGASLTFRISDFVPRSLFQVQSGLYPMTEKDFKTDISNVSVRFSSQSGPKAPFLTLNWMGQEKVLQRARDNFVTAMELFSKNEIAAGIQVIIDNKEEYITLYPNLEYILNSQGYARLRQDRIREAIQLFRLNVELSPDSYNAYDSLGEAMLKNGDKDAAIKNYKKSLELNPKNSNAEKMLESITNRD